MNSPQKYPKVMRDKKKVNDILQIMDNKKFKTPKNEEKK
jgi:hypothetical protein